MTAQLEGLNRRFELTEERIKVLKTINLKNYINRDRDVYYSKYTEFTDDHT